MSQSVMRMAPPSRYSVENFDPRPDDELVCSICRGVFQDPVECSCSHVFCRTCIVSWLAVEKSCPLCRKRMRASDLTPVVPIIRNMIQKLRQFCPNSARGCPEKVTLEGYDAHIKMCLYEVVKCKNYQCNLWFTRKDVNRHEEQFCEHRLVQCQNSCGLMLPLNVINSHNCIAELKKNTTDNRKEMAQLQSKLATQGAELKRLENELKQVRSGSMQGQDHNEEDSYEDDDDSMDDDDDYEDEHDYEDEDDYDEDDDGYDEDDDGYEDNYADDDGYEDDYADDDGYTYDDDSYMSEDSSEFSSYTDSGSSESTQSYYTSSDGYYSTAQNSYNSTFQSFTSSSYSGGVSMSMGST